MTKQEKCCENLEGALNILEFNIRHQRCLIVLRNFQRIQKIIKIYKEKFGEDLMIASIESRFNNIMEGT
jgi:hypothetical protein